MINKYAKFSLGARQVILNENFLIKTKTFLIMNILNNDFLYIQNECIK